MNYDDFPKRSMDQHRAEWMYYQIIADKTGCDAYDVYQNMALRILKVELEDGSLGYIKPSTLNSKHHNEYMEKIRAQMAEFDIILPDPSTEMECKYEFKKFRKK